MNKRRATPAEITEIKRLRATGHSLPEIRRITNRGSSVVWHHIQDVKILPEYQKILREKQGGSKQRAQRLWEDAQNKVSAIPFNFNKEAKMLVAACLYWGEGTKNHELALANSDPILIKTFVNCLKEFGVTKDRLKISVRVYEDLDKEKCLNFWANLVGLTRDDIVSIEVLKGKKTGKLEYGMCRVRVTKGAPYFKMLKSCIELIKTELSL